MKDDLNQTDLKFSLRSEWRGLAEGWSRLDKQTVTVLLVSAAVVIVQMKFGSRSFFRTDIAPDIAPNLEPDVAVLASWTWWFGVQGLLGFIIPVLILRFAFRQSATQMGLGAGDWRFASLIGLLYLPVAIIGTWILSDGGEFQANYPHYEPAATNWTLFILYESVFLFYWMGWEYLWRGFVLFGTARVFGVYAIFIQAVPFAILHYAKPFPEAMLSIVGGVALGALVWRARSFWIAVPIHAVQMLLIDFFSSLRIRTGVSGIGIDAIIQIFRDL